ncbi:MAG: sigma-70 family RNA polymerase sigma factor [Acidimicrobiia bacterium]|nr:sigma-70 family RNA polymerase sigma factor [Acidimicrobiia bacterium]MDH4306584.1 sigma-70 family RNA polymerase sigma factor [Acidimicrobiia bacterium]
MTSRAWRNVDNRRAYLYRAVANEASDLRRTSARRRAREAASFVRDEYEIGDPRPEVRRAIEDLSVRQRAVVYLTYWDDLSEESVALHLGIARGSVRRHLARARERLREVLHGCE